MASPARRSFLLENVARLLAKPRKAVGKLVRTKLDTHFAPGRLRPEMVLPEKIGNPKTPPTTKLNSEDQTEPVPKMRLDLGRGTGL